MDSNTSNSEAKPLENLGWANGDETLWPKFAACMEAKHKVYESKSSWNCVTEYSCRTCGYYFNVDSSG